ncbi:LD-carboxypeptidase [Candidatus Roizmanbacteria bacterium]|nr:LD-carboxypeptidase [Candidatus Roizmanbacteria bacterium]
MIIPSKLQKGDIARVIAPARSLSLPWIQKVKDNAIQRFEEIGLQLTFGRHVSEIDEFSSSSIESRIEDLHEAFGDPKVKLVITVIGGFNSNQLLRYINYNLIQKNPKILCGYSDITALANTIYSKTGLVTYSGPHFFNFGDKKSFNYTKEYFLKCFFQDSPYILNSSQKWSDDLWADNQEERTFYNNPGYLIINEGEAEGTIIGGNLCTLNLLRGTEYMPKLNNSILFIEDDYESLPHTFDRDLQSFIHQYDFIKVKGIVIGRFQKKRIVKIVASNKKVKIEIIKH